MREGMGRGFGRDGERLWRGSGGCPLVFRRGSLSVGARVGVFNSISQLEREEGYGGTGEAGGGGKSEDEVRMRWGQDEQQRGRKGGAEG